ncbi:hypothetical protein BLOT_000249 [Blomia tropicalis]|nr:hypothetical protein BLOT_000249 [Blomia tropicalis]
MDSCLFESKSEGKNDLPFIQFSVDSMFNDGKLALSVAISVDNTHQNMNMNTNIFIDFLEFFCSCCLDAMMMNEKKSDATKNFETIEFNYIRFESALRIWAKELDHYKMEIYKDLNAFLFVSLTCFSLLIRDTSQMAQFTNLPMQLQEDEVC